MKMIPNFSAIIKYEYNDVLRNERASDFVIATVRSQSQLPSDKIYFSILACPVKVKPTLMSSLDTFSQNRSIFFPPSGGAVTSLMSMICSSFLALASNMFVEQTGSRASVNLPGLLGSSRKA